MAYFDHSLAAKKEEELKQYQEIKKLLHSADTFKEFKPALYHMEDMELMIEEQKKEIEHYKKFFAMLGELIPRQSSIYDVIR